MEINTVFRITILVILTLSFFISGSFRKRARKQGGTIKRQEEGWLAVVLRLGFALPLLAVIILNVFLPQSLAWAKFALPLYLQIIALILASLCLPLLWWVFSSIGKNISETVLTKENHELVKRGPYSRVRHPLYGTALLLLFSTSLVFGDWIIMGYSLAGLLAFRLLVIPAEEKQLLDSFGEEYERYQARTGALLPWIR